MTPQPLAFVSLSWGVQSFGLAAMSALGVLPPVDAAVFSEAGFDHAETLAFAHRWTPWLEDRGVKVVTVHPPARFTSLSPSNTITPPYFTLTPDGRRGMLRRACTSNWKTRPVRAYARAELKARGLPKTPGSVHTWLGITADEAHRARTGSLLWNPRAYPFLTMLDHPWTRQDVIHWLEDEGLEVPQRSTCIICPLHENATWRQIKTSDNGDWQRALDVDRAIRTKRKANGYLAYLHPDRVPLDQVDLRNQQDHGQLEFWENR